jgi:hypothetical protein
LNFWFSVAYYRFTFSKTLNDPIKSQFSLFEDA